MTEISQFHPDMLIWIDETGSEGRNSIRKYGYSLRGMRAQVFQLRVGGKHVSAIPILATHDVYTSKETINGERFDCVSVCCHHHALCWCESTLSFCDASIHHLARVQDIITGVGARLVFLSPYSPDLVKCLQK